MSVNGSRGWRPSGGRWSGILNGQASVSIARDQTTSRKFSSMDVALTVSPLRVAVARDFCFFRRVFQIVHSHVEEEDAEDTTLWASSSYGLILRPGIPDADSHLPVREKGGKESQNLAAGALTGKGTKAVLVRQSVKSFGKVNGCNNSRCPPVFQVLCDFLERLDEHMCCATATHTPVLVGLDLDL